MKFRATIVIFGLLFAVAAPARAFDDATRLEAATLVAAYRLMGPLCRLSASDSLFEVEALAMRNYPEIYKRAQQAAKQYFDEQAKTPERACGEWRRMETMRLHLIYEMRKDGVFR